MTSTRPGIWDNLNNCQLQFDYPDLPETIRKCVEETIAANISICLDPKKAKGQCLRISDLLMLNLAEVGKRPFIDCKIIHTKKPHPHFWIFVDGWHIDLTAIQFNPKEPCPKIWKNEGFNPTGLYTVERGRGKVLFQLVPFSQQQLAVYPIRGLLRVLKQNVKKPLELAINTINESFGNWSKQENSLR
jgi:hypothetical protein